MEQGNGGGNGLFEVGDLSRSSSFFVFCHPWGMGRDGHGQEVS